MSFFGFSGGERAAGAISLGQAALIMIGVVLSITIFVLPGPAIVSAGTDAYLSVAVATLPSALQIAVVCWLARRFGWQSPWEYLPRLLGRVLGTAVSTVLLFTLLLIAAAVDQEIVKVVASTFMPVTPILVFVIISMLAAAYVAWLGMEAFGRLAQLMLPLLVAVLLGMTLFLLPRMDFGYLLPILHHGWRPVWHGAATPSAMRSEIGLVLAFMFPHLRSPRHALRAGVLATCLIGLLLVIDTVMVMTLFSPSEAARLVMPTVTAARMVRVTKGVEHLDFLIITPWAVSLTLKVALFLKLAADGLQKLVRTASSRSLVLPLAGIIGLLGAWMYPSPQVLATFLSDAWPGYAAVVSFALPLLLALVALVSGRKDPAGGGGRQSEPAAQGAPR